MRTPLVSLLLLGCAQPTEVLISVQVIAPVATATAFDRAVLHLGSVRGLPCDSAWQYPSLVSSAWAHGGSGVDPHTLIASRGVELLAAGDVELGALTPPVGAWCGVEVEVVPGAATATSLLVESRREGVTRQYASVSTRRVSLSFPRVRLDSGGQRRVYLRLDPGPALSTIDPLVNDPRTDLLQLLLSSLTVSTP